MEREFLQGVIYKLIKYADYSAIGLAFCKEYGKIKLFLPKAYRKGGGILTFVPGEIDFIKKERSDLNKFISFRHDAMFMKYVEDPFISVHLTLFFDIFDNLYELEQKEEVLWTLLLKFIDNDPRKVLIFSIYAMLKNVGLMFGYQNCSICLKNIASNATLLNGSYYCSNCSSDLGFHTDYDTNLILRSLSKTDLYKNLSINKYQEFKVLDLFVYHINTITGKKIKSYNSFKDIINLL